MTASERARNPFLGLPAVFDEIYRIQIAGNRSRDAARLLAAKSLCNDAKRRRPLASRFSVNCTSRLQSPQTPS